MRAAPLVLALLAGCGGSTAAFDGPGGDDDAGGPLEPDVLDTAVVEPDVAVEASSDAGSEAPSEAAVDSPSDVPVDSSGDVPVDSSSDAASDAPEPPATGYRLPLKCGGPYTVTQGNFDTTCTLYSHSDKASYAYDFGVGLDTPVLAMRAGEVILVKNDIKPPHPCYWGGNAWCAQHVNYVVLKHDDGFATLYMHLNDASVPLGKKVAQGEVIGLSGGTGWSTGPHMHVQKQEICGTHWCQSVPLLFDESATRLDCGMKLSSKNGC